jgi:HlyD family secretion protein
LAKIALGAVIAAGVVAAAAFMVIGPDQAGPDVGETAQVTRGSLRVTISASGETEAEQKETIRNELPWSANIRFVVPDGTPVEKGDKVLEFECTQLEEALEREKLATDTSHEAFLRVQRNLDLKKKELDNMLASAVQAVEDAKADLKRYRQGEYPIKLAEHKQEIALAERDRRLAEEKLNFKKEINADPKLGSPYSENDLKAEQLSVDRLRLAEQKAKSKLEMLVEYDHPREIQRLEAGVVSSELGLERAQIEYEAELSIAQTELRYKEKSWNDHKSKYEEYQDLWDNKRVVRAAKSGFVVYDSWPWWRNIKVAVGEEVRPRHQLMIIPNTSSIQVETKVYESMIEQVKARLESETPIPCHVRLDAFPSKVYSGYVGWVAPQPEQQDRRNRDIKVFKVIVEFDGDVEQMDLKTKMSAKVDMIIDQLDGVLQVPVAAIFPEGRNYYAYRVTDDGWEKVQVEVGGSNARRVEIRSGLNEKDIVRLTRPDNEPAPKQSEPAPERPEAPPAEQPDDEDDGDETSEAAA